MENLLRELREKNISVSLNDGDLKIRFDGNDLTEELLKKIKVNKAPIVKYLEQQLNTGPTHRIEPAEIQTDYVLSSSQQRLIILNQLEEGALAYHLPGLFILEGELNKPALERAFNTLISRHESLRTVFRENTEGETRQVILDAGAAQLNLIYRDFRNTDNYLNAAKELFAREQARPFDLATGPLLRVGLCQVKDDQWIFFYVMHHIVTDGWSMGILIRELFTLYNVYTEGGSPSLAPGRIHYKDFASWQQQQLKEGNLQAHKDYWLKQLEGPLPVTVLPADKVRPAVKTYTGGLVSGKLQERLSKGIIELSREEDCTLFMGLLAVVNTLLFRYTGQEDLIMGTSIAGRDHADLEGQIGFYINALALRTRFSGKNSFRELLRITRQVTIDAYEYQMYPFDELVNDLHLKRDVSRSPLFDVFIDFHDAGISSGRQQAGLKNLTVSTYNLEEQVISKFDLTFIFSESAGGLHLLLEYNADLFERETIKRIYSHFECLLENILSYADKHVARLEYLPEAERSILLTSFSHSQLPRPNYCSVTDLFRGQARLSPQAIALKFKNDSVTYEELDCRSDQLAIDLIDNYNVKNGKLVGIMLDRSEKMIIAILGILKAGGAYVPVDPAYPAMRKRYIMKNSGADVLITQADYIFDLDYFEGKILSIDIQMNNTDVSVELPAGNNTSDDLAYVIYTSGSTGEPKGCSISHGSLSNYIQWANGHYFEGVTRPSFGLFTSLSFDLTVTSIFCTLSKGGCLSIYDQYTDIEEILKQSFTGQGETNSIKITPSHINLLRNTGLSSSAIQCAIVGGEQLREDQVAVLKRINPDIRVYNEYGPTETTVGCMVREVAADEPVLIGKPIAGTYIYILDKENMPCPAGVIGEICIGGTGLAKGYLNRPEFTAEKFVPDPFNEGQLIYRSGDLGKWLSDGNAVFTGRKDEQVKVQGHRIELHEVEMALLTCEGIEAAVVVAAENEEAATELIAYLVSSNAIQTMEIRLQLIDKLPAFMVPRYFIQLERIPLTPNGKVDRDGLPGLSALSGIQVAEYVPPANETEEKLVSIWMEVLGADKISVKDNFFDLGGNSLKLVRVVSLINKTLDKKLSLVQLFRFPNIRSLAAFIMTDATNETEASDNEGLTALNILDQTLNAIR